MRELLLVVIIIATAAVGFLFYRNLSHTAELEAAAERVHQELEEQESGSSQTDVSLFVTTEPTSASGVEIDPATHRSITFEMW
ncbi:MAG: hypothetical protein AAF456_07080 [Planctomycetota bacterium]